MTFETRTNHQNQFLKLYQLFLQQRYREEELVDSDNKDEDYILVLKNTIKTATPYTITIEEYLNYKKTYTKKEYRDKYPRVYFNYKVEELIEYPGMELIHKLNDGNFVYLSKEFSTFKEIEDLLKIQLKEKEHKYRQ